jgi:hypothetical protein
MPSLAAEIVSVIVGILVLSWIIKNVAAVLIAGTAVIGVLLIIKACA